MSIAEPLLGVAGHLLAPAMHLVYSPARIQNRILCVIADTGPNLYINRHQAAVTGVCLNFRNGLPFRLKCESVHLKIGLDAQQDFGEVDYQDHFELRRYGGETRILLGRYKLTPQDVQWVKNVSHGAEMFCLNSSLNGKASFKTWFGEFYLPIILPTRVFVDLRDTQP